MNIQLHHDLTYKRVKCDDGVVRIFRTGYKSKTLGVSCNGRFIKEKGGILPIQCILCSWDLAQSHNWKIAKNYAKKHSCGCTV